jgi:hypothetical protein
VAGAPAPSKQTVSILRAKPAYEQDVSMSARHVLVIVFAVASAVCQAITVLAAWRELNRYRDHRLRILQPQHGLREVFATDYRTGVNTLAHERAVSVLLDQWTPSGWSIAVVKVVAPLAVTFGLAAAVIAEV